MDGGGKPWNHGLDTLLCGNEEDLEKHITSDFVNEHWKNEEFVEFLFDYGRLVSGTEKNSLSQIANDPDHDLFKIVSPSDNAWAVTNVIDKEKRWMDKWKRKVAKKKEEEMARKKGGNKGGKKPKKKVVASKKPATRTAKKAAAAKTAPTEDDNDSESDDEVEDDEDEGSEGGKKKGGEGKIAKARWTMTGKQKYGSDGMEGMGGVLYRKILASLESCDFSRDGWPELWEKVWEDKGKGVRRKKRKATTGKGNGGGGGEEGRGEGAVV